METTLLEYALFALCALLSATAGYLHAQERAKEARNALTHEHNHRIAQLNLTIHELERRPLICACGRLYGHTGKHAHTAVPTDKYAIGNSPSVGKKSGNCIFTSAEKNMHVCTPFCDGGSHFLGS